MLDHVISKLVLYQRVDITKDRIEDQSGLSLVAILKDPLNDSAPVSVDAELTDCPWNL
jgi:hypothetical protein